MAALGYVAATLGSAAAVDLVCLNYFSGCAALPAPRDVLQEVRRHWDFQRECKGRLSGVFRLPSKVARCALCSSSRADHARSLRSQRSVVVVWFGSTSHGNLCHALLMEEEASTGLALNLLQMLHAVLVLDAVPSSLTARNLTVPKVEHSKAVTDTFVLKPEEALVLLEKFLPAGEAGWHFCRGPMTCSTGQPLVLSAHLIKHLKREADATILSK